MASKEEENQVNSAPEPEPHHQVMRRRMKDSFTPIYQTVLSIIQGVALADLAAVVATEQQHFTVVNWLLVLITFCVLIIILNTYIVLSTIWDWIPDVRDAAIPFVIGALELFLINMIPLSLSLWLLGFTGLAIMAALETWYMDLRAREEVENAKLLSYLRGHHLLLALYYIGGGVLLLLLALVSRVGNIEASDGVQGGKGVLAVGIVILVGISVVGGVIIHNMYWRKALAYARTGRVPGLEKSQSNDHSTL